jgi:hypothetical protein
MPSRTLLPRSLYYDGREAACTGGDFLYWTPQLRHHFLFCSTPPACPERNGALREKITADEAAAAEAGKSMV